MPRDADADADFHGMLQQALDGTDIEAVTAEAVHRAAEGRLEVRDLRLLLLGTCDDPRWTPARRAALAVVVENVALAPSVLSMHAQLHRRPADTVREGYVPGAVEAAFAAQASSVPGETTVTGGIQVAHTRKTARQRAMASLLARLADLPDPMTGTALETEDWSVAERRTLVATSTGGPPAVRNPVAILHEFAQADRIGKPNYRVAGEGSLRFRAVVTCTHRERTLEAEGSGPSKASARGAAADAMLAVLSAAADEPIDHLDRSEPVSHDALVHTTAPATSTPGLETMPWHTRMSPTLDHAPSDPTGVSAAALFAAAALVEGFVRAGAALTLLPDPHPAHTRMLLFDAHGKPLTHPGTLPEPLRASTRDLVLTNPTGGMPRRTATTGWTVPLSLALPALLDADREEPVHASVTGWRAVARLGLRLVAAGRIHPALTFDGLDCWRVGPITDAVREAITTVASVLPPHAHCLLAGTNPVRVPAPETMIHAFLDALADTMTRTAGTHTVIGPRPWSGTPTREPIPAVWPWADAIEDARNPHPTSDLVLRIATPEDPRTASPTCALVLHLAPATPLTDPNADGATPDDTHAPTVAAAAVWDGTAAHPALTPAMLPGTRRVLRRGALLFPPLASLAAQPTPTRATLSPHELLELLTDTGPSLEQVGIRVVWPPTLTNALRTGVVVGTPTSTAPRDHRAGSGHLSLDKLVDLRWRFTLGDTPLDEWETTLIADTTRPLIHLRDRWLLVDPTTAHRARHRLLPPLSSAQALTAALSGTVTIDGTTTTCDATGTLADLVDRLRRAPHALDPVPTPPALRADLRAYQSRALSWLAHTTELGFGALLADDMGLGKTITTIALHLHRHRGPTLVICPASLVANWHREISRFAPTTRVHRHHGPHRRLDDPHGDTVVLTTYGTLRQDTDLLARHHWDLVIADEAQHVKNHASATAAALRRLDATARVAVTGTPVENDLGDLWSLLDWTNPGLFGTRAAFLRRYGAIERNPDSEAAPRLAALIAPFMLRRLKSDPGIAPELPPKVHHERIVALTPEQVTLYEAVVGETMHRIEHSIGIARRGLVVALLQALRQICNTPAQFLKEDIHRATADPDAFARRCGKLATLEDLLANFRERAEATLVFTGYVTMGRLLEAQLRARGRTPYFLHGQTPTTARQAMVDAFQHDPGPAPVFILSVKAGGTGLNLTRAAHVVHYDRPWNPAVEDQATDRAHRLGQHHVVNVHHLTTEGTVEDHIAALLHRKRALGEAVLLSGESALGDLDDRELNALVQLGTR